MPNLVVFVSSFTPPNQSDSGLLEMSFVTWTEDGKQANGSIPVDFAAVPSATHAALTSAAKSAHTSAYSTVFLPADKALIFAGQALN